MNAKQAKYPQLRFPEFTDPWEQRKSSEVFELITDYVANGSFAALKNNVTYSEKPDFAMVIRLTDFSRHYEGPFLYTSKSGYEFLHKSSLNPGDILISNVGANAGLVFKAPEFTSPMTLGPNAILVRTVHQDTQFMYQLMKSPLGEKLIKSQIGVSAQPKFNKTDFRQIEFSLPSLSEQETIARLLNAIDSTIALHQRKLAKLKKLKQGYLQKLFPKNGSKFPQLRFAGFADAWEQRKLGEIMDVTSVKRIHQSDWTNKGVRFFRARDIVALSKREKIQDPLFISKQKYNEYSRTSGKVSVDDLLVTGVGSIGIPYLVKSTKPLYFKDGNIIWFKNNGYLNGSFLYYSFIGSGIQSYIKKTSGAGTVGTFTIMSGKKTPILIPKSYKEQSKVGTFFQQLDETINLHQRKLEKLQELKKGYLQKMFC